MTLASLSQSFNKHTMALLQKITKRERPLCRAPLGAVAGMAPMPITHE